MKQFRMYLVWPIIFVACWYFFGFNTAIIVGFLYLHIVMVSLFNLVEAHKEKLVQIVQHISRKDDLTNSGKIDFSNIMTGDDVVDALTKIKK